MNTHVNVSFSGSAALPLDYTETTPALWFVYNDQKLLHYAEPRNITFPEGEPSASKFFLSWSTVLPYCADVSTLGVQLLRKQFLGTLHLGTIHPGGSETSLHVIPCFSAESLPDTQAPEAAVFEGLRFVFGKLDETLFALAGRAFQIVDWDRTHQFCSRCGAPTETAATERAKKCPKCDFSMYPRLSPAVIMLVERGDAVLLGRSANIPKGMYSTLAGFVEPGESLEETVRREVFEETGVRVKNIRYFGSQPWPFPNSLMIGFLAEYESGELSIDHTELEDAGWYKWDALPTIPPRVSIARQLIEAFLAQHREKKI